MEGVLRVLVAVAASFGIASCASALPQSKVAPPFGRNTGHYAYSGTANSSPRNLSIVPDAISQDLLYVSELSRVLVYSYPRGRYQGALDGGFDLAIGTCVDKNGNVYIADEGYDRVFEYAHGKSRRLRTLYAGVSFGCAVDPTTGELAVTNSAGGNYGTGSLAVFTNASGSPTYYYDSDFIQYSFCGYDNQGNLFVDGYSHASVNHVVLAELPKGGSKLITIALNKTLGYAGGVQWDGAHLAVTDTNDNTVYQFAINGGQGTQTGDTPLEGAKFIMQPWIQGSRILVPNSVSGPGADVLFYKYPAGGSPVKKISKHLLQPQGATISKAPT